MKFLIVLTLIAMGLAACDSPRNHRVTTKNSSVGSSANAVSLQSFKGLNLKAKAQWLTGPFTTVTQPSTMIVYFYNEAGGLESLPTGLDINFYANMVSMGHGLDQPGYFEEISPGVYINSGITLNMSGDWTMELWLQDTDFNILDKIVWSEFLQP